MSRRDRIGWLTLVVVLSGCSEGKPAEKANSEGGAAGLGGSDTGASAGSANAGGPASAGTGGAHADGSAGSAGAGGSAGSPALVELPEGSRELDGIVNLVNVEAAQELDTFLAGTSDLIRATNLFLTYYEERYDFVFLFTDHQVTSATAAGRFISITSKPQVGTGLVSQYLAQGYQTNGRLKGSMGVQYGSGPFAHEIAHYWAVGLAGFGFSPPHWGFAGVNGILGGFDPATLACQSPAGAALADCAPASTGRYRYTVKAFSEGGNGLPYAPLELYLMGLAPAKEVPAQVPVLRDAQKVANSFDSTTGTEVVEAAGISTVKLTDIQARYGVAVELAESARHFSSAFVVVSAAPASAEVLAEVALRAAAFGDRGSHPITHSFAMETGARATMDTQLGPRRAASDLPPPPRPAFTCDVLKQDCEVGLACYGTYCALPGNIAPNQPCEVATDCAAGSSCLKPTGGARYCAQYCDRKDAASSLSCASLCTSTITLLDSNGAVSATVCGPT
ncbi:MAG: hypothetical protein WDO74_36485 [Pseudomonadota bacterium]